MVINSNVHLSTTTRYKYLVTSSDGEDYVYYADIDQQFSPREEVSTNVSISDEEDGEPGDHNEIVEKIEEDLSLPY